MYETFFQLTHRPFAAAPAASRYIPTNSLEQARTALARVIERAEGPGLVVGPAGTGKSLLCQLLAQQFRGRFLVALLASARLGTRRALLQNILFELKLPYRELDESELRLSLLDHLEPRGAGGDGLLLLVDEAQTLPLRLWEEIRLITNLVRDGQPRVRLVMAGNMAMEERLASPKLESLNQRLAARCYLQPMGRDETTYYIQEQVKRAGGDAGQLFTDSAQRAVHTATDGIPRLVNQVCDHALLLAALGGHRQLGHDGIEEAWADLQQLPAPWHEAPRASDASTGSGKASTASSAVEFGQLDELNPASVTVVGPYRSAEGDAAAKQLDAIDSGLSALGDDAAEFAGQPPSHSGEPDDFSPASESATEVELIFHSAHDPFGGGWEEEEVVIDRYAELEDARLRRVASDEGRKLAAALDPAAPPPRPRLADTPSEPQQDSLVAVAELPEVVPFDPASDPLLPEEPATLVHARPATISLRDLATDDRDIIVVQGERPPPDSPPAATTPPKRKEYRQLFSSLRKR